MTDIIQSMLILGLSLAIILLGIVIRRILKIMGDTLKLS